MTGFTKLNLVEDVENSAEKFGMGDVLAAHFARDDLGATEFGLSLQRLSRTSGCRSATITRRRRRST